MSKPPARQQVTEPFKSKMAKGDRVLVRWELFSQPPINPMPLVFGHAASNRLFEWAGANDNRLKRVIRIIRKRALAYRIAGYRQDAAEKACNDLAGHIGDFTTE